MTRFLVVLCLQPFWVFKIVGDFASMILARRCANPAPTLRRPHTTSIADRRGSGRIGIPARGGNAQEGRAVYDFVRPALPGASSRDDSARRTIAVGSPGASRSCATTPKSSVAQDVASAAVRTRLGPAEEPEQVAMANGAWGHSKRSPVFARRHRSRSRRARGASSSRSSTRSTRLRKRSASIDVPIPVRIFTLIRGSPTATAICVVSKRAEDGAHAHRWPHVELVRRRPTARAHRQPLLGRKKTRWVLHSKPRSASPLRELQLAQRRDAARSRRARADLFDHFCAYRLGPASDCDTCARRIEPMRRWPVCVAIDRHDLESDSARAARFHAAIVEAAGPMDASETDHQKGFAQAFASSIPASQLPESETTHRFC